MIPQTPSTQSQTHSSKKSADSDMFAHKRSSSNQLASPIATRDSSSFIHSKQQQLRRPMYGERSISSSSLKQQSKNILNNSSLSRSMLSFQAQQRNPNILITPTKTVPNVGANNSTSKVSTPSKIPPIDKDKKRLVEQFYNTRNESFINSTSANDLSSLSKNSNYSSLASSPTLEKSIDFLETVGNEMELSKILNQGGFVYYPPDHHITNDEDLTNYLLNIDSISDDLQDRDINASSLSSLSKISQSMTGALMEPAGVSITEAGDPRATYSLVELRELSKYLKSMYESTNDVLDNLIESKDKISSKYKSEITVNIDKSNDLLMSLNNLEGKLDIIKLNISSNKQLMASTLEEKIQILEYVNSQFINHSNITRFRRLQQLGVLSTFLVLLLAIYLYFA